MTLRKKILFYALLTLITLATLEGMSRLAYYFAFAEWYPPALPQNLSPAAADLPPTELTGLTRRDPRARQDFWLKSRISHPYYGFTAFSPDSPLNVMPPPQTNPDTVTIALLGGSLAWELTPYFQDSLTRHFNDQNLPKAPVVIPLAYPAMKQPQQLHIASFMLTMGGHFDLLVNLDGFNELNHSYLNFTQDVFPFFPGRWEKLVFLTRDEIALAGQIRAARDQLSQLQQTAPTSPFRYTALYGILHRYQLQQAQTRILQLNYALANQGPARSLEQQGPLRPFRDSSEMRQEAVRVWYRSSALLSRLAAAAGADYYHFLQPNQYIPDAKPLSPEEQRNFYVPSMLPFTDYAHTYPLLQQLGSDLQQHGINYFDLTQIFNAHPETLYSDGCCHLNRRGYELLAAAIVQRLAPTLRRRAADSNPQPSGPLTVAALLPLPPTPTAPLPAPAAAPTNEPDFQVSLRPGNLLVYIKNDCRQAHTAAPFFLHITPADPARLPADRRRHGYESRDFSFNSAGFRTGNYGGRYCLIERTLPDYPITSLRTGQFNPAGEIWSTELTVPP